MRNKKPSAIHRMWFSKIRVRGDGRVDPEHRARVVRELKYTQMPGVREQYRVGGQPVACPDPGAAGHRLQRDLSIGRRAEDLSARRVQDRAGTALSPGVVRITVP